MTALWIGLATAVVLLLLLLIWRLRRAVQTLNRIVSEELAEPESEPDAELREAETRNQ